MNILLLTFSLCRTSTQSILQGTMLKHYLTGRTLVAKLTGKGAFRPSLFLSPTAIYFVFFCVPPLFPCTSTP